VVGIHLFVGDLAVKAEAVAPEQQHRQEDWRKPGDTFMEASRSFSSL
jgi:hypothetical protein